MKDHYFELKAGVSGVLTDGRKFTVIEVPKLMVCSDGSVKYGDVVTHIEGNRSRMSIEELAQNVKSVGDLIVRFHDNPPKKIIFSAKDYMYYCPQCQREIYNKEQRCICGQKLLPYGWEEET